jgi:hypothetical protein
VREGKNLRGRLTGVLVSLVGKGVLSKALKRTVKTIENRDVTAGD